MSLDVLLLLPGQLCDRSDYVFKVQGTESGEFTTLRHDPSVGEKLRSKDYLGMSHHPDESSYIHA